MSSDRKPSRVRVDRGRLAKADHERRLKAYLKDNLDALVRRQKLVADGKIQTKLSVLELPHLTFGRPENESLGQGGGKAQAGKGSQGEDGKDPVEVVDLSGRQGADEHSQADQVEIDFAEFVRLAQEQLLDELELPALGPPRIDGEVEAFDEEAQMEVDRPGLPADLDLERTMLESLGRTIRETGAPGYDVDLRQDGWYQVDAPSKERSQRALEVYVLDISGSVSGNNIALIRKYIFILWHYLGQRYKTNARRYVIFQDSAETLEEHEFFRIESKGGTHISSGLKAALEAAEGFDPYDRYLFFFSDGDNSSSDDDLAKEALDQILERFDMICYGRINPCDSPVSPFNKLFREKLEANPERMTFTDIKDLDHVKDSITQFLNLLVLS